MDILKMNYKKANIINEVLKKRVPTGIIMNILEYLYKYNNKILFDNIITDNDIQEQYFNMKFIKRNIQYKYGLEEIYSIWYDNIENIQHIYKSNYGFIVEFNNKEFTSVYIIDMNEHREIVEEALNDNEETILYINTYDLLDSLKYDYRDIFDDDMIDFLKENNKYETLLKICDINYLSSHDDVIDNILVDYNYYRESINESIIYTYDYSNEIDYAYDYHKGIKLLR